MYEIKQSTAITVPFFAHDVNGDGVTGMVDAGFTKRISKNGGAFAAMTVTITEMENGWYSFPLSTVHSDTLGLLTISFSHASAKRVNLQWRVEVRILDDLAFPNVSGRGVDVDATGGVEITANQAVNVAQWNGSAVAVPTVAGVPEVDLTHVGGTLQTAGDIIGDTNDIQARLPAALISGRMNATLALVNGTADSGSATTMVDTARSEADADYWKGDVIVFTSGTLLGEARLITAFDPATDTITFAPPTTVAVGTHNYDIIPAGRADVELWDGVAVNALIAGRVDANAQIVGDKTGYSLTQAFPTNFASMVIKATGIVDANVEEWRDTAPNILVASRVDASVGAMATDVISAAAIAAAGANKIADHTLRRTYANARTSANGDAVAFRSLLGGMGKLVNRWNISGTTLTVYQEDDVTATAPGGTQTITGTAGANPITQIDTD